jgi:hypothetical protein
MALALQPAGHLIDASEAKALQRHSPLLFG